MKKSLFKKIIAVLLALVTLMLAGCQKDKPVQEESDTTIQEKVEIDYHNPIDYFEPGAGVLTYDNQNIMDNTIDLNKVDFHSEFNIRDNHEISVPYPTSLGTVYLVREHLTEKSLTYIFVTTQDEIIYEMVTDIGFESIVDNNGCVYELYTANVDNEPGEEIILMTNTGGNGGRGSWITGVYKIAEKEIAEISFAEDGYKITAEKPFKYIITNEFTDLNETVEADREYTYAFEEDGTPMPDASEYFSSMVWYIRPEDIDNDGICEIVTKEWNRISKETEKTVDLITTYKFDEEQEKFVVYDTSVMLSSDEDDVYGDDYRYYARCDINNDGNDEIIVNYTVKTNSEAYPYLSRCSVYTYNEDNRLVYAGETGNNYSGFYCPDNTGNLVEISVVTSRIYYNVYSLENNKLVKVDSGKDISIEYEDELYERLNNFELEWKCY